MDIIVKTQADMEQSILGVKLKKLQQNNWATNKTKVKDAGQHVNRLNDT